MAKKRMDLDKFFEEIEERAKQLEEKGFLEQGNLGPIKRQKRRPKTHKGVAIAYPSVLVRDIRIQSLGRPSPPKKLGVSLRNTPEQNRRIILEKIRRYDMTHLLKQLRALRAYWHRHDRQRAEDLITWAEDEMIKEMEKVDELRADRGA